jgi:hypothetical protein
MNTLEIEDVLKNHLGTRFVCKGVYARNRLHRQLNVPSALAGNTEPDSLDGEHWIAMYIDANSRGEYYDPMGQPPYQAAYVAFLNKQCTSWTYNAVRVQEEGSTVSGQHCIYYLIHRCRGYSMTNITGSQKNPKEATDIVKTFVYRLINKA